MTTREKHTPKLDHVAIQVTDLEASITFYTEKLGFELLFHQVDQEHCEEFAFLKMEGVNLELLQILDSQGRPKPVEISPPAPPYCPHLALQTDNLDAEIVRLQQCEIPLLAGPLEISGSVRWLYFCDLDNNILEYVQWLAGDVS